MSDKQAGAMFWVVKNEELYLEPRTGTWRVVLWSAYRGDAKRYGSRDAALEDARNWGGRVVAVYLSHPTYNHTRGDGPFDPCPVCLQRMRRSELIELVNDLRGGSHE